MNLQEVEFFLENEKLKQQEKRQKNILFGQRLFFICQTLFLLWVVFLTIMEYQKTAHLNLLFVVIALSTVLSMLRYFKKHTLWSNASLH